MARVSGLGRGREGGPRQCTGKDRESGASQRLRSGRAATHETTDDFKGATDGELGDLRRICCSTDNKSENFWLRRLVVHERQSRDGTNPSRR